MGGYQKKIFNFERDKTENFISNWWSHGGYIIYYVHFRCVHFKNPRLVDLTLTLIDIRSRGYDKAVIFNRSDLVRSKNAQYQID